MKNLIAAVVIFALAIALFIGVNNSKPKPQSKAEPESKTIEVRTQKILYQPWQVQLHSQGTVQAAREVQLTAEVSGRIIKVNRNFAAGGFIKADEVLLEIDSSDYQLALSNSEASLAQARENYATIKAQARQAKREWRDLGNDNANQLFLKKPQLARAKAQLEAAEASKNKALRDIQRCKIKAPFAGRLVSKQVELGQFVNPGSPLASLYASDKVEVMLPLSAKQLDLVELGAELDIRLYSSSNPSISWPAKIIRSSAKADNRTRMLALIAEVEQPFDLQQHQQALQVGSFVTAAIPSKQLPQIAKLPRPALQVDKSLLVLGEDSRLRFAKAEVISQERDWVYLRSQLEAGSEVVISNLPNASSGLLVKPQLVEAP